MIRLSLVMLFAALFCVACGPTQRTYHTQQPTFDRPTDGEPVIDQAEQWPTFNTWEKTDLGRNDVAVIVAIEEYAFLPSVPGAVQTANDWENFFRSRGTTELYVVTNRDAPAEEIERFVKQAAKQTKPNGTFWFIFVGHGSAQTDGKDGVLVAMDAQQTAESLQKRSVPQKKLVSWIDEGSQNNSVVILDTCFSGRSNDGKLLAKGTQPVIPVTGGLTTKANLSLFSAAKADQVAGQLPGESRPAFSYLMLGAMRGWADLNGDGSVSADEAASYTQQQMRLLKGRQQTPGLSGSNDVVLASGSAERDPGVAALMKNDGKVKVKKKKAATGSKSLDPVTPLVTYDNLPFSGPDYGIVYPNNWVVYTRSDSSDITGWGPKTSDNDNFQESFVVTLDNANGRDLQTWFDQNMAYLPTHFKGYKLLSAKDTTLAGLPAKLAIYEFDLDGFKRVTMQWYVMKGKGGFIFSGNCQIHELHAYGSTFQKIADTIVIE